MNIFDDNPLNHPEENLSAQDPADRPTNSGAAEPLPLQLAGDPLSYQPIAPATSVPPLNLPEDLRISWSWPHLLVFLLFWFSSQFAIAFVALAYFSMDRHLSPNQLQKLVETDPKFLAGTTILWSAIMLFFLYMTLAVLRDSPFWSSLGWKKLSPNSAAGKGRPWMYFLSGCGLYIFVAVAGSRVKEAESAPIQEFLKNRTGAMLLMAMAVLVAPLVEETLFRGYLYPVLARIISAAARFFGMESSSAVRTGVGASILITGVLFGLMHAPQLGYSWGFVGLLILVGVIFTFARAWTGSVLASFLLHLGYNSTIAVTAIISTKGFTHMPPVH
jgi:membrane protease YdiL (CAAX protease family)